MLLPKTAFYKPRIPRSELKLPTIKFPSFFQTHARGNVTQNVPKTVTTEVPSSVSDLVLEWLRQVLLASLAGGTPELLRA